MKRLIVAIALFCVLVLGTVPAFGASAQYFFSKSESQTRYSDTVGELDSYKRSVANYTKDEQHYLRARVLKRVTNKVMTDTGRIYSNKRQLLRSDWVFDCKVKTLSISTVKAVANWGS